MQGSADELHDEAAMRLTMHSTMRDPRVGARADVTVYTMLAAHARAASRRGLATTAAAAGAVALVAVVAGLGHWTLLTACYLAWSYAVWGLVFGPPHPATRTWRVTEALLVASDTVLAVILAVGLFYLALGPRWML